MQWTNNAQRYGWVSAGLHWLMALVVFGMFGLGWWMVGLGYYDPWRHLGPEIHKGVGVLLFAALVLRLVWRLSQPSPAALPNHGQLTRLASKLGHLALYLGLFAGMIAGYLISTADGRPIPVFNLFEVPATLSGLPDQEDIAGAVHKYLAWGLVIFALLHGLAALKHHVIDRDRTLLRMLGR